MNYDMYWVEVGICIGIVGALYVIWRPLRLTIRSKKGVNKGDNK